MTRLEAAQARFAEAMTRLEEVALSSVGYRARAERDGAEIARLRQEREALIARVQELEEEGRQLAGITEEVEQRLDGAIAEIRSALGKS